MRPNRIDLIDLGIEIAMQIAHAAKIKKLSAFDIRGSRAALRFIDALTSGDTARIQAAWQLLPMYLQNDIAALARANGCDLTEMVGETEPAKIVQRKEPMW